MVSSSYSCLLEGFAVRSEKHALQLYPALPWHTSHVMGCGFAEGSSADYLDDPLYGHSRYRKLKDLNEGTFGIVVLAIDVRSKEQVRYLVDAPRLEHQDMLWMALKQDLYLR